MPTMNEANTNCSSTRTIMMSNSNDTNNNSNNKSIYKDLTSVPAPSNNSTLINNIDNQTPQITIVDTNSLVKDVRAPIIKPYKYQSQNHLIRHTKDEWKAILADFNFDCTKLSDEDLLEIIRLQVNPIYKLENLLGKGQEARCVKVRRKYYQQILAEIDRSDINGNQDRSQAFSEPSIKECLEYDKVNGACCENVVGSNKHPVGIAGPLFLDDQLFLVPLATFHNHLVSTTNYGMKVLHKSGGIKSIVWRDFMTRAPAVRFKDGEVPGHVMVNKARHWLENNFDIMKKAFDRTSSHAKLLKCTTYPIDNELHIRFEAHTADAMGMNMCSKGAESAISEMKNVFKNMDILNLSGNMCTDKKAAAMNYINGRGKEVQCLANIPANIISEYFGVSVETIVDRWTEENLLDYAMKDVTIGRFCSQAEKIVVAMFIACGQDPAQNLTSSNCLIWMSKDRDGSLKLICRMPSIECGTVGGGTILHDQSSFLQMMGIKGATPKFAKEYPDGYNTNACRLARIICATVMAAELSYIGCLDRKKNFDNSQPSRVSSLTNNINVRDDRKAWYQRRMAEPNFDKESLSDDEIIDLVNLDLISIYRLGEFLGKKNAIRCVDIRRKYYKKLLLNIDSSDKFGVQNRAQVFEDIFNQDFLKSDLSNGAFYEHLVAYVNVPTGIAGPLRLDGEDLLVPLATTEGCLVASTSRGMSALRRSNGVRSTFGQETEIRVDDSYLLAKVESWLRDKFDHFIKKQDQMFTNANLVKYSASSKNSSLFIKFKADIDELFNLDSYFAFVRYIVDQLQQQFPSTKLIKIPGPSLCRDASGCNNEVICKARIPDRICHGILKVHVDEMIDRWNSKMKGSALAGCTAGGFNCQAANILTAMFIATGQDAANNVVSSNCTFRLKKGKEGSLKVECRMQSIKCCTIGDGTILEDPGRYLQMMAIKGETSKTSRKIHTDGHNTNACKFTRIICATVLAAELSLLAALTEGTLVKSHMRHNRSSNNVTMPVCEVYSSLGQ